jgi:hypothetical protein
MGLSIHYSGYILNKEMLDPLIEEVTDICKSLNWESHIFDEKELKGVCFAPKRSEPVFLTFNENGRIFSPTNILLKDIYDDIRVPKESIYTTSTKTQYAGADAHIAIIKLLKHISKKYLKEFTLTDEGYYWETDDEKILQEQFEKYNSALDSVGEALNNLPSAVGETPESLAERLEKLLREKFGGEKNQ